MSSSNSVIMYIVFLKLSADGGVESHRKNRSLDFRFIVFI